MSRLFTWFRGKKTPNFSAISRRDMIKSFIVQRQTKEFTSCLRNPADQSVCLDAFILLLTSVPDEQYMSSLFEVIRKHSRLSPAEFSAAIVSKLSHAILEKDFELCERILRLPLKASLMPLPTFELIRFMHTCSDREQLFRFLSNLIEKNLPYDAGYHSWILIILFEHYQTGDDEIIEYLFKLQKSTSLLHDFFGNNSVTPLMLFLHLYSNEKCQKLMDNYFSSLTDQSVLLKCDKWNRSYLMHLLCGHCEHEAVLDSSKITFENVSQYNAELVCRCPHASSLLARFSMLHRLGNRLDQPLKTIFKSQFCLPLRMLLFNYLLENDSSFQMNLKDFFVYFPDKSLAIYSDYLKHLVQNYNQDGVLESYLLCRASYDADDYETIRFLLKQGLRANMSGDLRHRISSLLCFSESMIPFLFLDYSTYIDPSLELRSHANVSRVVVYMGLVTTCGYPTEFREKFDEYTKLLPDPTAKTLAELLDVKNPPSLSRLCTQKLRSSVKNLGDDTIEQLDGYLPKTLKQSLFPLNSGEYSRFSRLLKSP